MAPTSPESEQDDLAGLRADVLALDGRGYKAYKALTGLSYRAGAHTVHVRHVQGDPFADPTRLASVVTQTAAGLPHPSVEGPVARRATADFLHRRLAESLASASLRVGSGNGGRLATPPPAAEVLARTAILVGGEGAVELRFRAGLPARGRRVMGRAAADLLCDTVPRALARVLPLDEESTRALTCAASSFNRSAKSPPISCFPAREEAFPNCCGNSIPGNCSDASNHEFHRL
jgi:predicted ABC-class ATPase